MFNVHILIVEPDSDFAVERELNNQGTFTVALRRTVERKHKRTGQTYYRELPLFPGYLLANFSVEDWARLKSVSGVSGYLPLSNDRTVPHLVPFEHFVELMYRERSGEFAVAKRGIRFEEGEEVVFLSLLGEATGVVKKCDATTVTVETVLFGKKVIQDVPLFLVRLTQSVA